jgi:mannose-6-phosphate isomerase-like protein (cupin superfamily)
MVTSGQTFENPVTGERMTFVKAGCDTDWMLQEIEFVIPPGSQRGLVAHFHLDFDERFEILEGTASYTLGDVESFAQAGDTIFMPRKVPHIHPWNIGQDVLRVRKITQLDTPQPQLLLASAAFFESLYALAQQKKVKPNGLPSSLFQTFVLLQALEPSAYVAITPPMIPPVIQSMIQKPIFGLLAAIGRAAGYQSCYFATPLKERTENHRNALLWSSNLAEIGLFFAIRQRGQYRG